MAGLPDPAAHRLRRRRALRPRRGLAAAGEGQRRTAGRAVPRGTAHRGASGGRAGRLGGRGGGRGGVVAGRRLGEAVLPPFSPYQTRPRQYVEIFNRGRTPFPYEVSVSAPWLRVDRPRGRVEQQVRLEVEVDWSRLRADRAEATPDRARRGGVGGGALRGGAPVGCEGAGLRGGRRLRGDRRRAL
ncbi:hypothetical protein LT493_35355 [Streptomyces tricolor]|nr:hypothetical protein [Streptomyces tricolor]